MKTHCERKSLAGGPQHSAGVNPAFLSYSSAGVLSAAKIREVVTSDSLGRLRLLRAFWFHVAFVQVAGSFVENFEITKQNRLAAPELFFYLYVFI